MTNIEMKSFIENIQNKLGDSKDLILDDLAKLTSDTTIMNSTIEKKDSEIEKLKERNNKLVDTNNSLFQQVGFSNNESEVLKKPTAQNDEKPKTTKISFRDCFDEKGNFKK